MKKIKYFLIAFSFFPVNSFAQFFNTTNDQILKEEALYNYEQELEEYQNLKLVKYLDFIFFIGFKFGFFPEQNSVSAVRTELNSFKNIYNSINPATPYEDGLSNPSIPFGITFGLDIYYYDIGFGFHYSRNNFLRSDFSIRRASNLSNYEDYFLRYTYNMFGDSFFFNFMYRISLLKQTPENNLYFILGVGYNYNQGIARLKQEHSFLDNSVNIQKTFQSNTFQAQTHGGHVIFELLVKLENFIISTGFNLEFISFSDIKGTNDIFIYASSPEKFLLNTVPVMFFKTGFTF